MGMTLAQKIIARTAGQREAAIGDVLICEPDLFETIDLVMPHYIKTLRQQGIDRLRYPERVIVFADHEVPSQSERTAQLKKALRQQLADLGITHFYSEGRHGISHQAIVEKGHVLPGMLVTGPDTHITTLGCVGALSPPINYEAVQALATGEMWLKVPETIRIELSGRPNPGVMSRDIGQWIIAKLGAEQCDYRVLEYGGQGLAAFDMDARMTLCNVAIDVGAKAAVVEPDDVTFAYLRPRTRAELQPLRSDPDAVYARVFRQDLTELEPMIAAPPSPDNVVPISSVAGIKVDQVYIGSCAGGRLEDLRAAAHLLRGRKVHPRVTMIVVPTSQEIFANAAREGLLDAFIDAGAVVNGPSCGPCYGNLAPLVEGDVCVCTGTTNMPGRMGSTKASIYLSNAITASAAAIAGEIVDPRELAPRDAT
jgi:3-isopropylmalate/(R)-2-methylmalate dehydratase large subunit